MIQKHKGYSLYYKYLKEIQIAMFNFLGIHKNCVILHTKQLPYNCSLDTFKLTIKVVTICLPRIAIFNTRTGCNTPEQPVFHAQLSTYTKLF